MRPTALSMALPSGEGRSGRRLKNLSLTWKLSGVVALCLGCQLAVVWASYQASQDAVQAHLEDGARATCQTACDVNLSVLEGVYAEHVEDVRAGTVAVARALAAAPAAGGSSREFARLVEGHAMPLLRRLSFMVHLDRDFGLLSGALVQRSAGASSASPMRVTSAARYAEPDLARVAREGGEVSGTVALPAAWLEALGLADQAVVRVTDAAGAGSSGRPPERRGLAALTVARVGDDPARATFVAGGYLLSRDGRVLGEALDQLFRVRRLDQGHDQIDETVLSLFLGHLRVATTAHRVDGAAAVGTELKLPPTRTGEGATAVWRGTGTVAGLPYFTTYRSLIDPAGRHVGYLGCGIRQDTFLAQHAEVAGRLRAASWRGFTRAMALGLLLALCVGFLAARVLISPLAELRACAEAVASGDLAVQLRVDGSDEIGTLAAGFRGMVSNLRALSRRIEQATADLAAAAEQIMSTLHSHAATTTEQSAAVTETTAALEELAASSRQIAENALSVVKMAAKSLGAAQRGVGSAQDTITRMDEIAGANGRDIERIRDLSAKLDRVDEVMTLINTVADQTKLIAFNAAIEAAGAGEAGRRFGVVSAEIRRLAESVRERAAEIRGHLAELQEAARGLVASRTEGTQKIEAGAQVTRQASANLNEILNDSQSVLDDSKQISLSTQQQRSATEQTLGALREINLGVTSLARGAKETEQVVERLGKLAAALKESVAKFKS